MQDANEVECLIFEVAIRNIVLGKVTKSGVSEANNKLIINIFLTVGSYRPQQLRNRVNSNNIQEQFAEVLGNINRVECGSEVNAAVKSINEIFLCCAEPYKTHVYNFHGKKCSKQSARWYDDDCHKLRAKYNSHRNKFRKSEGQRDKMSRDEAKKEYVTLCKRKSAAYETEQSELLLKCKYKDSNIYWQQIKPRSTKMNHAMYH